MSRLKIQTMGTTTDYFVDALIAGKRLMFLRGEGSRLIYILAY